jgi:putative transposase
MNNLYMLCGISKQSHLQAIKELKRMEDKIPLYLNIIHEARSFHPTMGLRNIYETYEPNDIGRDAFISLGKDAGLQLEQSTTPTRTTFSVKSHLYKNLLSDMRFTDVNQLWTSDITYYRINDKFYYITFIMDVYSRRIIGYHAADNMRAENNVFALLMAIQLRGVNHFEQHLIHHSDKGSQYASNDYTNLLTAHGIRISMCNEVYENTHIERVNGTIKNDYLKHYAIDNFNDLKKGLKKAVQIYNDCKPHCALIHNAKRIPPVQFELELINTPIDKRLKMSIYTCKQNVANTTQLVLNV